MNKYIFLNDENEIAVVSLGNALPHWTLLGEIGFEELGQDDPLIHPKNPYASPTDFFWPENMFLSRTMRLSELKSSLNLVTRSSNAL